jgi:hypothetical protein
MPASSVISVPVTAREIVQSCARSASRLRWSWLGLMLKQDFLYAPGAWGSDALIDRECLPQVRGAFICGAVLEVAVADSFQGACFLQGHANVAGDCQRSGVTLAGPLAGRGPG